MPTTAARHRAQAALKRADIHQKIPKPNASNGLTVTDGETCIGTIVEHDGSHFAFEPDGQLVGEYATRVAAMRALPRGGVS
jgi:hypothetical protein